MDNVKTKRGPLPTEASDYATTNVRIPREDLEWAKRQKGGMSATVRRALVDYRKKLQKAEAK